MISTLLLDTDLSLLPLHTNAIRGKGYSIENDRFLLRCLSQVAEEEGIDHSWDMDIGRLFKMKSRNADSFSSIGFFEHEVFKIYSEDVTS